MTSPYKVLDWQVLRYDPGGGSPKGKFYQTVVVTDGGHFWALANWGAGTEAAPRRPQTGQVAILSKSTSRASADAMARTKIAAKTATGYRHYTQYSESANIELVGKFLNLLPLNQPAHDPQPHIPASVPALSKVAEGLPGILSEEFLLVLGQIASGGLGSHELRVKFEQHTRALEAAARQAREYVDLLHLRAAAAMREQEKKPAARARRTRVDNLAAVTAAAKGKS